jgi:hypothetical protein
MNLKMRKIRILRRFHYALWIFVFLLLCFDYVCTVSPWTASRRRPVTYEYYPLRFWNHYSLKDVSVLQKAYELEPDEPDSYTGFILHQEFTGMCKEMKQFCQKLYRVRRTHKPKVGVGV